MSSNADDDKLFVSIVMPAYNEEEAIADSVLETAGVLAELDCTCELLVVDDGSSDGTFARLGELKRQVSPLRVVRFAQNRGQTAAMAAGIDHARGDVVITLDADGQNDPHDIPKLLELMGEFDVVCGIRKKRQDNAIRRLSSRIANGVRNRLTHESIKDTGCTLKAFRTSYLRKVKLFEGMHRFLPTLLRLEGARVTEVPVNHRPRMKGTAKYGVWNRLFKGLRDLFAVRWMQRRHIHYDVRDTIE